MKNYIKLLRIHQWVKNVFVFAPLFFSGNFFHENLLLRSLYAFVFFSMVSSSIYIINDYMDIETDKIHPKKKHRPLASGAIPKTGAVIAFFVLILITIINMWAGQKYFDISLSRFFLVTGFYFVMNLAYSFKLKQIAIVDVCIISFGFVLRVASGGFATGIFISQWAILLTFVLALFLALGKRRGELITVSHTEKGRKSLEGYSIQFADVALSLSVSIGIISYLMFTLTPEIQGRFGHNVFYTFVFVVFAFLRYLQQTIVYNHTESPTKTAYKDRYIQITILLWIISFMVLIYV
ncbi:MAG: decaprenyl-phosphate phosphoribosyltransferase [Bergeyella sp.]|nr:decaprenyl-phosphate phosphoribosyltransferase [Bergeyella sp.]